MKKLKTLLCALAAAFGSACLCVSAAEQGENSKPVMVKVLSDTSVFSVAIEWDDMNFEYTRANWDDSHHAYNGGGFSPASRNIQIANHSDKNVTSAVAYSAIDGTNVSGSFSLIESNVSGATNASAVLESAAVEGRLNNYDNPAKVTYGLSLNGSPNFEGEIEVGTVSVTLS